MALCTLVAGLIGTADIWWAWARVYNAARLELVEPARTFGPSLVSFHVPNSPPPATLFRLGPPPTPISVSYSTESQQHVLLCLYEANSALRVLVLDKQAKAWDEIAIPAAQLTYGVVFDRDDPGIAWITTAAGAGLYRYDLREKRLETVLTLSDDSHIFGVSQHPSGDIYLGTFPSGRCIRVARHGSGWKQSTIAVSAEFTGGRPYLHGVFAADKDLFLHYASPARLVRHSLTNDNSETLLDSTQSFLPFFAGDEALVCTDGPTTLAFDRAGRKLETPSPQPPRSFELAYDGTRGLLRIAGESHEFSLLPRQRGMSITCLRSGPDGRVYGGTYWNTWAFSVDAARGEMHGLGSLPGGCGEFFTVGSLGDRLLIPNYQGALYSLDLSPVATSSSSQAGFTLLQQVPTAHFGTSCLADADGDFIYATCPNYNQRGGMLVVMKADGTFVTHERLGDDLTLDCLTIHDGMLLAGTMQKHGLGLPGTHKHPAFVVQLDKHSGEILEQFQVTRPRGDVVSLVSLSPGRLLCAATDRRISYLDTTTKPWKQIAGPNLRHYSRKLLAVLPLASRPGVMLVVLNKALVALDTRDNSTRVVARLPTTITHVAPTADGGLLFASLEGIDLLPAASLAALVNSHD